MNRVEEVEGNEGYEYLLRGYLNGFQEPHLFYQFNEANRRVLWGGILVIGDQTIRVVEAERDDIAIGATLETCNGMPVGESMKRNTLRWHGISSFPRDRIQYSPYIFADLGNPWCERVENAMFRDEEGREVSCDISYEEIDRGRFDGYMRCAFDQWFSPVLSYGVTSIDGGGFWIQIPSFNPKGEEVSLLKSLIEKLPALRAAEGPIVFDL